MHTIADKKLLMLRPESIAASKHISRKSIDPYELEGLAESIQANGIIEPLIIRKNSSGGYELIAGLRRLEAAKACGLRRVPCVLHKADDKAAALYSVLENIKRCNLSFFEEAQALKRLCEEYEIPQSELAASLGIAKSSLCNKLRILKLDEALRQRIEAASLTERHARALLKIPPEIRSGVLDKIIAEELSLKQTEALIEDILSPQQQADTPPAPMRKAAIGDIRLFANSLSRLLATMQNAGIDAHSKKYETEKYIEYKVRISKNAPDRYTQLKIC